MSSKTNAMRILDKQKINYNILQYEVEDGKIDGISVAEKINKQVELVYKTLVAHKDTNLYVFVIPVTEELDLKKAAKAASEKKLDMLPVKELFKWTGYIRGGCSPVGMKKNYPTFIQLGAMELNTFIVSAGKIGLQIETDPQELAKVTGASFVDVIK